MRKRLVLAFSGLLFCAQVNAQSSAEVNTKLQNGRLLVDQQKYALAMAELLPLTTATTGKALAPEAAYLYSVAASRQKQWTDADRMLTQLTTDHATWAGLADAQYLHGYVLFEKKEYLRALNALATVQDAALSSDVANMKRHYLLQLTDKNTFQYLVRQFPQDAVVSKTYADKLVSGWLTEQDRPQLEAIVRQFNLDRSYLQRTVSVKKPEYNVAFLLPFSMTPQGSVRVDKKNLFITDFYAGVLLAQDSLLKQGVRVNVFPYDTSNDTAQVRQVMEHPEMASMDLLVGPVFKNNSAFAAQIAQERRLNMVNPFSDDADITKGNPYLYLMETSVATQGQRAAAYAYQNFPKKTAVLIYDSQKDDTTFAGNFRRTYTALGGKITTAQKINSKASGSVGGILGGVNLKETGVVVIQAAAANVAASTISFLEQRASKVPVLVPQAWLDHSQISFSQLDFLEVFFMAPKFIDAENPAVQAFKKTYTSRYNLPPSAFSYAGFELLYYYGKQLQQNGYSAPLKLSPVRPGALYQGVGYQQNTSGKQVQDNQYLPILKLENGALLVVNPAF